jgi:hypothetical protein
MLHVPGCRGAQIGAGTGRTSVVLILTGLLLVAAPVLGAGASSCGPHGGCSSATTGNGGSTGTTGNVGSTATNGNGGSTATTGSGGSTATTGNGGSTANTGNGGSTATGGSVGHGTPAAPSPHGHAPAGHTTTQAGQKGDTHNPHTATTSAGSGSTQHPSGNHRSGGGQGSHPGVSSNGTHVGSATAGASTGAVIGRLNPPVASGGEASHDGTDPVVVVPGRVPRARMAESFGATGAVARVAGALRFPAVLLGVILLFLTLQQRADRRDPKLANAPVGSRQETLEFR